MEIVLSLGLPTISVIFTYNALKLLVQFGHLVKEVFSYKDPVILHVRTMVSSMTAHKGHVHLSHVTRQISAVFNF